MPNLSAFLAAHLAATKCYPHPTWVPFAQAYSIPTDGFSQLQIVDDFGNLVRGGYCYSLHAKFDWIESGEEEFPGIMGEDLA